MAIWQLFFLFAYQYLDMKISLQIGSVLTLNLHLANSAAKKTSTIVFRC